MKEITIRTTISQLIDWLEQQDQEEECAIQHNPVHRCDILKRWVKEAYLWGGQLEVYSDAVCSPHGRGLLREFYAQFPSGSAIANLYEEYSRYNTITISQLLSICRKLKQRHGE